MSNVEGSLYRNMSPRPSITSQMLPSTVVTESLYSMCPLFPYPYFVHSQDCAIKIESGVWIQPYRPLAQVRLLQISRQQPLWSFLRVCGPGLLCFFRLCGWVGWALAMSHVCRDSKGGQKYLHMSI